MQDWIGLLIAFVVGFFMKHLLETVCESRLIEGSLEYSYNGHPCDSANKCVDGYECVGKYCLSRQCAPNHNPDGDGEWKRFLDRAKRDHDFDIILGNAGPPLPATSRWGTPWKLNIACGNP